MPGLGKDTASYFRHVARYFLQHPESAKPYLSETTATPATAQTIGPQYALELCDKGGNRPAPIDCDQVANVGLTRDLFKGDRSMRESGFDVSFRFDPYSAGTHHYAPVCLNSLLYKAETDLERISQILGRDNEAAEWRQRAANRREAINKYLWNVQRGLFFDYNFETGEQSSYVYITTFYPL